MKVISVPTSEPEWREAFAHIGELVQLSSALDFQTTHIVIEVLHLEPCTMLEPVVATLDSPRKLEILKARVKHIKQPEWKKGVLKYCDNVEKVQKARNAASHSQMIKTAEGFVFASSQAAKLFKGLRLEGVPTVDRLGMSGVKDAISIGERTLAIGQNLLENFARLDSERKRRGG